MAPRVPKVTRLDDDAEIYKARGNKSEKQKFSEMNGSEKFQYFKDYYLKRLIIGLLIVGFVTWMLIDVLTPKPESVLSVAMADFPIMYEDVEVMNQELNELLDINEETQKVLIDYNYNLESDYTSYEKLTTYFFAGEIDIFIAPEVYFKNYAFSGTMLPLTELPVDLFSKLNQDSGRIFECQTREDPDEIMEEAQGDTTPYAIYIDDLPIAKTCKEVYPDERILMGIAVTGEHQENAIKFIRYVLEQKEAE